MRYTRNMTATYYNSILTQAILAQVVLTISIHRRVYVHKILAI